jgi:hypothetical protein
MRFPKRIRHRGQVLATIYAKSKSYRNIKDQEQDALAPPCHNLPGFGRMDGTLPRLFWPDMAEKSLPFP